MSIRNTHTLVALLALLAFALTGCVTSPQAPSDRSRARVRHEIEQRLEDIFDACAKKDMPRLDSYHAYGSAFTKFAPEAPRRLASQAARDGEHIGLSAVENLVMRAVDLQVDAFGDVAVATFVLDYGFVAGGTPISKRANTTMVFIRQDGGWRITHEHLSVPKANP